MRIVTVIVAVTAVLALLGGCSSSEDEVRQRDETVGTEIADGYNRQMEKARQVEDLSFEHKDRLDEALEESEGASRKDP